MTIHYHGTPITPRSVLLEMAGRCFCVPHANPNDAGTCHQIGQSVMLDNSAYSFWRSGKDTNWPAYYEWAEPWLDYPTTWAVIPDVIDGSEQENDRLLMEWNLRGLPRGAPVWHLHESMTRLLDLACDYERVCIGSSGAYKTVGSDSWHRRMCEAMDALCGNGPVPVWLHMLRGMDVLDAGYPFASVDSTDVARNHNRPQNGAVKMAARWDAIQCQPRWVAREQLSLG